MYSRNGTHLYIGDLLYMNLRGHKYSIYNVVLLPWPFMLILDKGIPIYLATREKRVNVHMTS